VGLIWMYDHSVAFHQSLPFPLRACVSALVPESSSKDVVERERTSKGYFILSIKQEREDGKSSEPKENYHSRPYQRLNFFVSSSFSRLYEWHIPETTDRAWRVGFTLSSLCTRLQFSRIYLRCPLESLVLSRS
jgi:hypothetical protein